MQRPPTHRNSRLGLTPSPSHGSRPTLRPDQLANGRISPPTRPNSNSPRHGLCTLTPQPVILGTKIAPGDRPMPRETTAHGLQTLATCLLALAQAWCQANVRAAEVEHPTVLDERLEVELLAAEPELVTPVGVVADQHGRIFVIESHTHFRPADYAGPPTDRIRVFTDADLDGRMDDVVTWFEGTSATMGIGLHPDGALYLATRSEVWRLKGVQGGRTADESQVIVRLETAGNYPHNGLAGFAFDAQGWVYFGLGENLGEPYALVASDGTTLIGGGEGGSIFRIRADGSGLERVATGFWNPFHVAFDGLGHLFAVDNDPDSRPPCRLLHIVTGGDYGYRYRNGRKGLHPFTAWNGELPGTLPMVAGTGEAPSGIVYYAHRSLPEDYQGTILVTSWGDHRLDRFRLQRHGASFTSQAKPFVLGGENFRPVGITVLPDGSLLVSDWVDKSYELHGKGRLWRVRTRGPAAENSRARAGYWHGSPQERRWMARRKLAAASQDPTKIAEVWQQTPDPESRMFLLEAALASELDEVACATIFEQAAHDPCESLREAVAERAPKQFLNQLHLLTTEEHPAVRAALVRRHYGEPHLDQVMSACRDQDPFVRRAGIDALVRWASPSRLVGLAQSDDADLRLAATIALREQGSHAASTAARLLDDADARVRQAAVQWIAECRLDNCRPQLISLLAAENVPRQLFEACLAALERLDGVKKQPHEELGGDEYVATLLTRPNLPASVLVRGLRRLRPDHPVLTTDLLDRWLAQPTLDLQLEALRTLREQRTDQAQRRLVSIAQDEQAPLALRAEAVAGLLPTDPGARHLLIMLAQHHHPSLRAEALRTMQHVRLSKDEREAIAARPASLPDDELLRRLLDPDYRQHRPPKSDLTAWLKLLEGEADPDAGERVFFHPQGPRCYRCHELDGRGGAAGPELSLARNMPRTRLLESLLLPSKEVAPHFLPWQIVTSDGRVLVGLLVRDLVSGEQVYMSPHGETFVLHPLDIERRAPHAGSIMPDNLVDQLTVQELRDLLARLQQGRTPHKPSPHAP